MIPTWATEAMKVAGVDAEGWVYDPEDDCMEYVALPHGGICLNKRGEISVNDVSNITVDGALRLADRLRRALTGEPDPRVAELERELDEMNLYAQEMYSNSRKLQEEVERLRKQMELSGYAIGEFVLMERQTLQDFDRLSIVGNALIATAKEPN